MRRFRVVLSVAVVGVIVTAASAYALVNRSSTPGPSLNWHWAGTPGQPVSPTEAMRVFADRSGVPTSSIRQVVASASGLSLIVGTDATGRVCTAQAGGDVAGASNFNCLNSSSDKFAMLLYSTEGGPSPGVADHASLVGIARPDVTRVAVTTVAGAQINLSLNQWGGFAYDATSMSTIPASISAYDSAGGELDSESVYPAP
jgi:hypothetical protein